jgi:chromate transporter
VGACLKGMQSGVAAVIADVVAGLGSKIVRSRSLFQIGLMIAAFLATWVFGVNVALIILACGALSAVITLWNERKERDNHAA